MVKLPQHVIDICKAKDVAQDFMPYTGRYLEGVPTVFDERVPTMAVDDCGRLYVNPNWLSQWSPEQNGYVLLHEMLHNLLDHAARREAFLPNPTQEQLETWNEAADLCIQQILEPWDKHRPGESVNLKDFMARVPGIQRGMSTEKYYGILWAHKQKPKGPTPPPPPGGGSPPPRGGFPGCPGNGQGDEQDDQSPGQGSGQSGDEQDDTANGLPKPKAPNIPQQNGNGGPKQDDGQGKPKGKQQHKSSGSASDGIPQDYELPKDLGSVGANLARLQEVLQAMEDDPQLTTRGSGMGTVKQAISRKFVRVPDPFEELKAIVGRATAAPTGLPERTFRRMNRRQEHDDLPIAGEIKLFPECVIVVDTSGSMGNPQVSGRVAKAMAAIAHGVRRLQQPRVICWDDGLQNDRTISSIKEFKWEGGGGTSMAAAVEMADRKYRPDAIVLVTDCGTDWPDKPTRSRLIVAMVAKDCPPPKWAKTVDLTREAPAHVG
jgi:predicted metal-dependent peptidase